MVDRTREGEDMNEGKYNPEGRSGQLLKELEKKTLTSLEFQRACAKWLLEPECWKGFYPKDFPSKTEQILKHESMPKEDRKNLSIKYYEDNPEVLKYINRKLHIFAQNEQRVKDIEEFMGVIDNAPDYEKLKAKKKDLEVLVAQQGMELGIKRYVYNNPEYQRVAKEFEGEIS